MVTTAIETKIRPFRFEDGPAVIDLFNAHSQYLFGWDDSKLDDLMNEWTSPGINVEETIRVVENAHGEIIGYIDVWDNTNPHVTKYTWGILHPDAWDEDLYRQMLIWAETCARERINLAPDGSKVIMNHGTSNKDIRRKKALEKYGFDLVRHFYRMQIELGAQPTDPIIPQGLKIVPIDIESELKAALVAMDDGFKDHWGHVTKPIDEMLAQWEHYIENDEDFDPSLWYLAKDGDEIAGICRCSSKMVEDPDMGWVNQLCVRKQWRKRGLGRALLLNSFQEFYRRGKKRVGLGVDASSLTNATRLYEKAGMHISLQYDTYELEIRTGKDLAKKVLS